MPARSERQRKFFLAVKGAKHNPNAPEHLKKVANSMSDKDIDDFIKCESEFKTKKAILSVLKDIVEPMYLNEDTWQDPQDPVSNTFHVKADWATYIKPYIGQPLSPKELEALHNFKEKQPTTVARTEIWYNTTDNFNISHTTVIKKMKDSGQFSFTAFSKQERPTPDEEKDVDDQSSDEMGSSMNAGGPTDMPQGQTPPGSPTPSSNNQQAKQDEKEKDDIIVTKSILFKDDIKGASILIDFLKKLDL
jgi:hypothetical protein